VTLLLDSHVLLWILGAPERLSVEAAEAITAPDNIVLLSVASVWEFAIKQSLGKLTLPGPVETWLRPELDRRSIALLPVLFEHAAAVRALPQHHSDPFDRLLVAQTRDGIRLVTHDQRMAAYDVPILWT
jgi:PIN domain nuclease of toxin-antitoxin system